MECLLLTLSAQIRPKPSWLKRWILSTIYLIVVQINRLMRTESGLVRTCVLVHWRVMIS